MFRKHLIKPAFLNSRVKSLNKPHFLQKLKFSSSTILLNGPLASIYQDVGNTPIFIEKFNNTGFTVTGDQKTRGALIMINSFPFQWSMSADMFLDEEKLLDSVRVFEFIRPKPGQESHPVPKKVTTYLNALGIQVEVMNTRNASSTYNVLIEEGRLVSAALLLPASIVSQNSHN